MTGETEEFYPLIVRAKEGDSVAFEKVYTILYTPLYRYLFSKTNNRDLVEDICQQTFLLFYEHLATYEPVKSPLAYLFTIAKRLLINSSKKKGFTSLDEMLDYTEFRSDESALDSANTRFLSEKLNSYLPLLNANEEEVIRLFFYSELTYTEIANTLKKTEASIRKIKERALKKLRDIITD